MNIKLTAKGFVRPVGRDKNNLDKWEEGKEGRRQEKNLTIDNDLWDDFCESGRKRTICNLGQHKMIGRSINRRKEEGKMLEELVQK